MSYRVAKWERLNFYSGVTSKFTNGEEKNLKKKTIFGILKDTEE
jgi:hypothetical protein